MNATKSVKIYPDVYQVLRDLTRTEGRTLAGTIRHVVWAYTKKSYQSSRRPRRVRKEWITPN